MVEIRKFTDIIGVILTENITDGRCVMLTAAPSNVTPYNVYGLREDTPGVKLPTSDDESKRARYVVKWAKDNRPTPLYYPMPLYSHIVRNYGFETGQSSPSGRNLPMTSVTVYLMHPQVQEGLVIPSGELGLAYGGGVYTFYSGEFVNSAEIQVIDNPVGVQYTAGADRGKPYYDADGVLGRVEFYDSTQVAVTVRTLVP